MCLAGDTLIPSSLGLVRFDFLHEAIVGDRFGWTHHFFFKENLEVATRNGPRRVTDLFRAFSPLHEIETEDGDTLKCVEDHPILCLVDGRPLFQPPVLLDIGQWLGKPRETGLFVKIPTPNQEWDFPYMNDWERIIHDFIGTTIEIDTPMIGQVDREGQIAFIKGLFLNFGIRCPVASTAAVRIPKYDQANLVKCLLQNLGIQVAIQKRSDSYFVKIKRVSYQAFDTLIGLDWIGEPSRVETLPAAKLLREYIRRLTVICGQNTMKRWSLVDRIQNARSAYRYASEKVPRSLVIDVLNCHLETPVEEIVEDELAFLRHLLWQMTACSWTKIVRSQHDPKIHTIFDLRIEGYPEYTGNGLIVQ